MKVFLTTFPIVTSLIALVVSVLSARMPHDAIETSTLTLCNEAGEVRGTLSATSDGAALFLFSKQGGSISASTSPEKTELVLIHGNNVDVLFRDSRKRGAE